MTESYFEFGQNEIEGQSDLKGHQPNQANVNGCERQERHARSQKTQNMKDTTYEKARWFKKNQGP